MDISQTPTKTYPRPLKGKLLIKQDAADKMVGSSRILFAPDGSEVYPNFGTVLALGSEFVTDHGVSIPFSVKIGDRVLFKRKPSAALHPDARESDVSGFKNLLMMTEEFILAVVEE